jgi:GNAT superfamily N-acetyltransferase
MWWRQTWREFESRRGASNRRALSAIVASGEVPGLLAYEGRRPVGWCAVGPRESYPALDRFPRLRRVDDEPVWSVVCFFVTRSARRCGLMSTLLEAAKDHARRRGARLLEAYPIAPARRLSGISGFTGVMSVFRRAGFGVVARRSARQPIMRCALRRAARPRLTRASR